MNFKNINFSSFARGTVELIFQTLRTIVFKIPLHIAVILSFIPNQAANFIFAENVFVNNTDRLFSGQPCFFLKRSCTVICCINLNEKG
jgi:hypothetical protein